jgi:hypothetical protein
MRPVLESVPAPDVEPGTRCFIVGNGKSLSPDQLRMLYRQKEICFGVNRIHLIYDKTHWRPTYWLLADLDGRKVYVEDIPFHSKQGYPCYVRCDIMARCVVTWLGTISNEKMLELMNNVTPMDAVNHIMFDKRSMREPWVDGKYNQGGSVAAAQQLALAWGYNPVYLIGCDGDLKANANNHFDPNYAHNDRTPEQIEGSRGEIQIVDEIVVREYRARNVLIYNATVGATIRKAYRRADFWELFE